MASSNENTPERRRLFFPHNNDERFWGRRGRQLKDREEERHYRAKLRQTMVELSKNEEVKKVATVVDLVSDDDDVSTSKLYSIMVEVYGKKARLFNVSPRFLRLIAKLIGKEGVIDRLCGDLSVDIRHTKNTLNWSPVISLVDGIKRCIPDALNKK